MNKGIRGIRGIRVRQATVADIDDLLDVLNDAAGFVQSRYADQWPERFDAEWLADDIADGTTWIASVDGRPAGTLALLWNDEHWTDLDGRAGYVHRLAVSRSAAGLGGELLAWAGSAVASHGGNLLRLQCVSGNRALRAYYESRGFVHRGDVPVRGPWGRPRPDGTVPMFSRYERPAA